MLIGFENFLLSSLFFDIFLYFNFFLQDVLDSTPEHYSGTWSIF